MNILKIIRAIERLDTLTIEETNEKVVPVALFMGTLTRVNEIFPVRCWIVSVYKINESGNVNYGRYYKYFISELRYQHTLGDYKDVREELPVGGVSVMCNVINNTGDSLEKELYYSNEDSTWRTPIGENILSFYYNVLSWKYIFDIRDI